MIDKIKWHKQQIEEYTKEKPIYDKYASILYKILNKAANMYAPLAIVQARSKTISSFAEKAIRKASKYEKPVLQLTDLCGARVITHFQDQTETICHFIKTNFEIDEKNSLDVSNRLKASEFGYLSYHYIIIPKLDKIMGIKIPEEIRNKKAEIQIRTILQHAWADIVHDRIYKSQFKIPVQWKRESARIAALLENADNAFARMAETIDSLTLNFGGLLSEEEIDYETNILKTILDNESESKNKTQHALKLAKLLKVKRNWKEIINILHDFSEEKNNIQPAIYLELGYALSQYYLNRPSSKGYREGISYLKKVAKPAKKIKPLLDTEIMEKADRDYQKKRSYAFALIAKSYSKFSSKKNLTRDYFFNAYQLDPSNPYFFIAYLEFYIFCSKTDINLTPFFPTILDTIKNLRKHIQMGIELVPAYFTLGKCFILLDNVFNCLNAYAKAIDLYISGKSFFSKEVIDNELQSIERISICKNLTQNADLVKQLLLLSKIAKNQKSKKRINTKICREKQFDQPITIIAGAAANIDTPKISLYGDHLLEAFLRYRGTVISGGTKSGIPGLIGSVTNSINRQGKREYELIGYIPKKMPKNVKKDKYYDEIISTMGNDFSALEPIQYWIDILQNNINPLNVKVLGMNGGNISAFEYRLALALGATVGLIESSGGAASNLVVDEDWLSHERLLVLPDNYLTVWAYINQGKSSQLREDMIDKTAEKVHEHYINKKIEDGNIDDPSMLPWKNLDEIFKKSNRQQVVFIEDILESVGYGIRQAKDIKVKIFKARIIEDMAKKEHARWLVERLKNGWKYGPIKDDKNKINPYLVEWDNVPDHIKDYDINAVRKFTDILKEAGFEVYKL